MFTATCELDEKAQLAMTCTNEGEGRTVREAEQCVRIGAEHDASVRSVS